MSLSPLPKEAWSARHARHLLNRAGFGVPWERVEAIHKMGADEAVASLVDFGEATEIPEPEFVLEPLTRRQIVLRYDGDTKPDADTIRKLYSEQQRAERSAIRDMQAWWLHRMAETPNPLEEKMTLFWHGHFAASAQKVKFSRHNYEMNALFRRNALGNFKELTTAVGQSPAMLRYLDNQRSTKEHPNENWARELMELFTLGVGHYTEHDIKESARAFTGWSLNADGFDYRTEVHDSGEKAFMGHTGNLDGWDVLNIIFEQPTASTFLCTKLYKYFVQEEPDVEVVNVMAETFRANNFNVQPVLAELFRSEAFYTDAAMGMQIKSPAQFAVQLVDDLSLEKPPYAELGRVTRLLGQDLFYPPNVKGWDGNRAWINANSLLQRYNLPVEVIQASVREANRPAVSMRESMDSEMMQQGSDMKAAAKKEVTGPTDADRKAYRERQRREIQRALKLLPPHERRAKREILQGDDPKAKRALMRKLGISPPPWAPKNPVQTFEQLAFTTARGCIDGLARRFLVAPLLADQRAQFNAVLGGGDPDRPLTPARLSNRDQDALLRLITSMAEYQLC